MGWALRWAFREKEGLSNPLGRLPEVWFGRLSWKGRQAFFYGLAKGLGPLPAGNAYLNFCDSFIYVFKK